MKVNAFFLTSHHVTPFKEKKSKAAVNPQGREKDDKLRRVLEEVLLKRGSIGYLVLSIQFCLNSLQTIKIPSKIEVQCS